MNKGKGGGLGTWVSSSGHTYGEPPPVYVPSLSDCFIYFRVYLFILLI